jgi:hypothetical protein
MKGTLDSLGCSYRMPICLHRYIAVAPCRSLWLRVVCAKLLLLLVLNFRVKSGGRNAQAAYGIYEP